MSSERAAGADPAPAELAELAQRLAREAGQSLLERFESGTSGDVHSKSTPTDLVSEADLASERLLRTRIRQARPEDGFLGEEGERVLGSSGLRWVVDPLDGTVNFIFGIPQWAVSVAVQEEGARRDSLAASGRDAVDDSARDLAKGIARPRAESDAESLLGNETLAGAIYDPCRDEMWSAAQGGAALLDGEPIAGSERAELATAMLATGLAYDSRVRAEQASVLAALIPEVRDIRRLGSAALDLAWTAAGRYDAYYERSVKLWDVAAGILLCECAGVTARELRGRDGLPAGVLVAAPRIVEAVQELVA